MARRSAAGNHCPAPQGTLLLIGGKEDKGDETQSSNRVTDFEPLKILQCLKDLTGKDDPVIEVVTTASSLAEEVFDDYKRAFKKLKISHVHHIHHTERGQVMADDLTERIDAADAIFFSGGDQLTLTAIYGGTNFILYIKQKYLRQKFVVAGTSAGAMAMSTPMIYAGNKGVQQVAGEIKIAIGFEFLNGVCIDTHFVDRSRFVRMAQVVATNPNNIGIGIEQDTAIIVRDGTKAEVIGNGIVTIIEGFNIKSTNITEFSKGKLVSILDLKVHLLAEGFTYDIPQHDPAFL